MRTETSILTSLQELKSIERQRIDDEKAARERDAKAREELMLESLRRAAAESEARREAAAAAEARARAEIEGQERERETAIAVAAATAKVKAEAELEAQRMAAELELRRAKVARTRPVGMIAIVASLVLGAGGLGIWIARQSGQIDEQAQKIDKLHGERSSWMQQMDAANAHRTSLEQQVQAQKDKLDDLQRQLLDVTAHVTKPAVVTKPPPVVTKPPPTTTTVPHIIQIDEKCKVTPLACIDGKTP